MLQPRSNSKLVLAKTRAKAKMFEYEVPFEHHIGIGTTRLSDLLDLTIALLGDLTSSPTVEPEDGKYKFFFSAQYFSALVETNMLPEESNDLNLLAAAAYFLADYPGSTKVLLSRINDSSDQEVFAIILKKFLGNEEFSETFFEDHFLKGQISRSIQSWNDFLSNGVGADHLMNSIDELRKFIYSDGSDREVFFIDVIRSVALKTINSSSWKLLPEYTDLGIDLWTPYLNAGGLKHLWPAQILMGENGIFKGKSGVIQMPTSAGKTRASELIIRSSFLSGRSKLAVIVAPFRALCQEIFNDLSDHFAQDEHVHIDVVSDVLQEDLGEISADEYHVMILTPEKLDYLLRHDKGLSLRIELVIYDEGHLFDDSSRGIKYELLLASLKSQMWPGVQTVLISAVISNAEEIKDWLIGNEGVIVAAKDLNPTSRSLAFTDWTSLERGQLKFTDISNIDEDLFFVPRLLVKQKLQKKPRERGDRFFPKQLSDGYDTNDLSGFLAARLASIGLTAVFAGRKDSVLKVASGLVDAYERGLSLPPPIGDLSDLDGQERNKVIRYIENLLGSDSLHAKAAKLGFLIHHGSVPHGLRLSIECALQASTFRSVICTSTLSQGVNLPIKYLVIAGDRQGQDRIKVRDFHNLMGRAGRAGKNVEGTVIFANPRIYASKYQGSPFSKWKGVKELVNSNNSEPCKSDLLSIFDPEPIEEDKKIPWTHKQEQVRSEINSYLLSALADTVEVSDMEALVRVLAMETLAYYQANEQQKSQLVDTFLEIAQSIFIAEPNSKRRGIFAKSVLSLDASKKILAFIQENQLDLVASSEPTEILSVLWPILFEFSKKESKMIGRLSESDALESCKRWMSGESYPDIFEYISNLSLAGNRRVIIDNVVDLCENGFGYITSHIVGSVSELLELIMTEEESLSLRSKLFFLQKKLKYGLPDSLSHSVYEIGLSDRSLCLFISNKLEDRIEYPFRQDVINLIIDDATIRNEISSNYPKYFQERLLRLVNF